MMRSESLFVLTLLGALCCTCPPTSAQDTGPYDQEMARWLAQEQEHLERLLQINFEQGLLGIRIPDDLLMKDPERTLHVLEHYQKSPSHSVRSDAYAFAWRIGLSAWDPKIRQRAVAQLAKGCFDPDSGQAEGHWLLDFREGDFWPETRDMIRDLVVKNPIRDHVILVLGVAGMTEMDSWLKKISDKHYSAVLALARLGDDDAARQIVQRIERIEDISERVRIRLDGLGYTRHPIALEYIASYLDNEEGEITLAQSGDYYSSPYNKTALDVIAKHFADCPVKRRDAISRYSQDDFAKVRQWLVERRVQAGK